MGVVKICFVLAFSVSGAELPEDIEDLYQRKYKKLLSFLYARPDMRLSFFIPGIIFEWIEKNHEEIISLCSELLDRRQIELLGGGYYEPLFPLLLPADRSAQIESLTTSVRKAVGKRPRGACLTESIWDPSLISSFNTCGIEYTFLDSRLIPKNRFRPMSTFLPLVTEDMGKTTTVIPLHQSSLPHSGQIPEEYLQFTHTIAQSGESSILACLFSPQAFFELMELNWFEKFLSLLKEDTISSLTLPQRYLKQYRNRFHTHIPAGCMSNAALWTLEPFVPHTRVFTEVIRPTVRDFLTTYPEARNLYLRMMYVSMLISQCRGDKVRKKAAKEQLHAAQNFASYIYTGSGGVSDKELRGKTYRRLIQAEKLVREASEFKENSSAFDFSLSGNRDFLCCFETFNAFFSLKGGILFELDIMHNASNYCLAAQHCPQNSIRISYPKKMFVDHLWDKVDFETFICGKTEQALFASEEYKEINFNRSKKEIRLYTCALWGKKEIPVSIKKNYAVSVNGIFCQYILKNEGRIPLRAKFAVEHNLSLPGCNTRALNAEIVVNDVRENPCTDRQYLRQSAVSFVQFTDTNSDAAFIFEPNELCGFYLTPFFTVTQDRNAQVRKQYEAHTCVFYWDVDILPGRETEKILNLTIKTAKRRSVAKKQKKQ